MTMHDHKPHQTFDQMANDWDANPLHHERTAAIATAMRRILPLNPQLRTLEVGCGTGLLSFALHETLGPITLTDTSSDMLAVVRQKMTAAGIENFTPLHVDLTTENLSSSDFDLVYMQMVLHHVDNVEGMLAKLFQLAAPGGHLCIADLVTEDGSFHGEGFTGHHGFDPAHLMAQVERAGFVAVTTETVYQLRREGHTQPFPVFLLVANKPA